MSTQSIVGHTTLALHSYIELLDNLPLLDVDALVKHISQDVAVTERHIRVASNIIQSRYTMLGYKDYMCCYLDMHSTDNELWNRIVDLAIAISGRQHSTPLYFIQHLLAMLYYHNTLVITEESGRGTSYIHKRFTRGTWCTVEKSSLNNAYRHTLSTMKAKLLRELGINDQKLDKAIQLAVTSTGESILKDMLHYPNFSDSRDDKTKVFCTVSGMVLDIQACICRLGLPGDLSTLSSNAMYDYQIWQSKRGSMMQALAEWLGNDEVTNYYLDCLASAVSVYSPRYALLNVGTGSDGKSTFVQVLHYVFGSYCGVCPTSGPGSDAKSANDVTPVLNMLLDKRVCLTPEVKDVNAFLSSPGYKSIVGGDVSYNRGMFREANAKPKALKMLCIFNTNQTSIPVIEVSERTRVRAIMFNRKTIDSSDKDIIPQTKIQGYSEGIDNYGYKFIVEYANTLVTELMLRYIDMKERALKIIVPLQVIGWTNDILAPQEIYRFIDQCTIRVTDKTPKIPIATNALDAKLSMILSQVDERPAEDDRLTIQKLYEAYVRWKSAISKYVRGTRWYDINTFVKNLEYKVTIRGDRNTLPDISQCYVTEIILKPGLEQPAMQISNSNTKVNLHNNVLLGMQSYVEEHIRSPLIPARVNVFQTQAAVNASRTNNAINYNNAQ